MHESTTTLMTNTLQGDAYMEAAATLLESLPENDVLAEHYKTFAPLIAADVGLVGRPPAEDWPDQSLGSLRFLAAARLLDTIPATDPLAKWAHALAESITARLEVFADGKETA